jgi:hypothetical protein
MCTGRLASLLYRCTHHNAPASTQYSRLHLAWDIYKSVGVVWDFVGWPHCRVDRHLGDGHEYPAMDLSSKHHCHSNVAPFCWRKNFFLHCLLLATDHCVWCSNSWGHARASDLSSFSLHTRSSPLELQRSWSHSVRLTFSPSLIKEKIPLFVF